VTGASKPTSWATKHPTYIKRQEAEAAGPKTPVIEPEPSAGSQLSGPKMPEYRFSLPSSPQKTLRDHALWALEQPRAEKK
jgi:hypothetical protein